MAHARLDPAGFWGRRVAQLRDTTLPVLLGRLDEHGVVDAFRRLRPGAPDVPRRGLWFSDSDLYKWMEAAAWAGRDDLLDPVSDVVQSVQQPDGYLHTFYGVPGGPPRYSDLAGGHELYCHGHFIEAALAHHGTTGDTRMLDAAVRLADHLVVTFGPGGRTDTDGHPEVELALVRLAQRTGDPRYTRLATSLCERAGLDEFDEPWGHAVRALYLAAGVKAVADATGDERFHAVADRVWASLRDTRFYLTGGVGGRWLGEMVGRAYELPSELAYAETCAAVAAMRFARLMGDRDAVERTLYNGFLAGIGLDGVTWFYSNPLAAYPAPDRNPWASPFDFGAQSLVARFPAHRAPWFDVTCCPTNASRMLAELPTWLVREDGDTIVVDHPAAGVFEGEGWRLEVDTTYPWGAEARTTLTTERPRRLVVAGSGAHAVEAGRHAAVWRLDADLSLVEAHARVEAARGAVAVQRGPVVYCAESTDHPGVDVLTVALDGLDGAEHRPDLLGGVTVVRAHGRAIADHGPLYRRRGDAVVGEEPVDLTLVPYFAWANRGSGAMAVWLRDGAGARR